MANKPGMTLDLNPERRERLREIAAALGLTIGRGPMAEAGSAQQMIDKIIDGDLVVSWVVKPGEPNDEFPT